LSTAESRARLRLLCRGLVQGVGFRPQVHQLARELDLTGRLDNQAGAVCLDLHGSRRQLQRLLELLPQRLRPPARLDGLDPVWLPPSPAPPRQLSIAASAPLPLGQGLIAPALVPDLAPCADCLAELADPADRRHHYPFISCSRCGPRYAIAVAEPFARAHTTMGRFPLCEACRQEFETPGQRRFHAETISCPACGPRLQLVDAAGEDLCAAGRHGSGQEPLAAAIAILRQGKILALQGVGGFQLLVEAGNAAAVRRLRLRKHRPHKPFALLVDRIDRLDDQVHCYAEERRELSGPAAPIVLLKRRRIPPSMEADGADPVAPGSPWLGVMLPASPLHHLLAQAIAAPLVATSGNRSGEPLCRDPDEARERLGTIADAFLIHNRPIARRLDDSLLRLVDGRPMLLRRARGYAPAPLDLPVALPPDRCLLALGGDLKSAPVLAHRGSVWPAPFRGDLADADQQNDLHQGLNELITRCAGDLEAVVCDAHPGYVSAQLAEELSERQRLPLHRVEHHPAHALAVVAEHGLAGPVLAWAADGLGYSATPPHGRGCELFLMEGSAPPQRLLSLRPFPLPGSELAVRDARRCALGLLAAAQQTAHPGASALRQRFAPADLKLIEQALQREVQLPLCSSLGRLFDALAALVAAVALQSHEGEAAMRLEALAHRHGDADEGIEAPLTLTPLRWDQAAGWLDWQPLLDGVLAALAADPGGRGDTPAALAAACHEAIAVGLAATLVTTAQRHRCRQVALSGGCFQNGWLLQRCITLLRAASLEVFWPEQLPCNDGGLALGQLWAARQSMAIPRTGEIHAPCAWPPPE
jgi:hydrogenase maturation protein HypF